MTQYDVTIPGVPIFLNYTQRRHIADTNDVTHVYCDVTFISFINSQIVIPPSNILIRCNNLCSQIDPKREVSFSNRNTVRDAFPNTTYDSVREL